MNVSNCNFRADGGVSRNDFVMQLLSTLTGQSIERPFQVEMSCLGAAFLAGLAAGVYNYFRAWSRSGPSRGGGTRGYYPGARAKKGPGHKLLQIYKYCKI